MKISLITPIYRGPSTLKKYLENMQSQSNKNFEIIFVVDTNKDKVLQVIDKFKKIKPKIKLIFNTKRQGRTKAIRSGINIATGNYSVITSASNSFKSNFIENLIEIANSKKTDIIEFKCKFKHPKKIEGKIRKSFNQPAIISENPEVIAMSYPFDFNKLFKTELLQRISKERKILDVNSKFSIAITYKALLSAGTYSTVPKALVTTKVSLRENFNPLEIIRQWKDILKYAEEKYEGKYRSELMYAKYYHEIVFLFAFTGASRNKMLLKKLKDNFNKSLENEFVEFFDTNKYALRKNKETEIIIENRAMPKLTKLFKEL